MVISLPRTFRVHPLIWGGTSFHSGIRVVHPHVVILRLQIKICYEFAERIVPAILVGSRIKRENIPISFLRLEIDDLMTLVYQDKFHEKPRRPAVAVDERVDLNQSQAGICRQEDRAVRFFELAELRAEILQSRVQLFRTRRDGARAAG
jgi:hypothetical protein